MIRASDAVEHRLNSLLNLQILVADLNDNGPKFTQSKYLFQVAENSFENETSLRINMSDMDDVRSRLEFRIESEQELDEIKDTFGVRDDGGDTNRDLAAFLITKKRLDYEHKRRFYFRLIVTDDRGFSDSTQIEVFK